MHSCKGLIHSISVGLTRTLSYRQNYVIMSILESAKTSDQLISQNGTSIHKKQKLYRHFCLFAISGITLHLNRKKEVKILILFDIQNDLF